MKKLLIALVLISATGYAQKKFMPGVRAGLNFARFTQNDNPNEVFNYRTGFYVSFLPTINLTDLYTLQPEIGYSSQGAELEYLDFSTSQVGIRRTQQLERNYFTLALINKFKFHGFNIHLGPTIEIEIGDNSKTLGEVFAGNISYSDSNTIGFDMGISAGLGYNFTKNFGIEGRIKKGIIPAYDDWDSTNLVYQVGAYYNFGK